MEDLLTRLRSIDEDTVARALAGSNVSFPITGAAQAVNLVQLILGVVATEDDEMVIIPEIDLQALARQMVRDGR